MATNGYITLSELKSRLDITSATYDSLLDAAIEAASRQIDAYTGRRFYRNATDETRYYTATEPDLLLLPDDLGSLTSLATDDDGDRVYETTWASTDYDLEPANAALDGQPYTAIRVTPLGRYTFPSTSRGVRLVGRFGYSTLAAVPDAVAEAAAIQAARLFKRRDSPFGMAGSPEFGVLRALPPLDPDVRALLAPFVRGVVCLGV